MSGPIRTDSRARASSVAASLVRSAASSRSARTSRSKRSRSRSSIALTPGSSPASFGKAASSHCAKAWIVSIRRPPPGQSSTAANSLRARARSSGWLGAPIASSSVNSWVSSSRTQRASTSLMRAAISVAPALVKVRHRIWSGRTPSSSSSRSTRAESTWVLPVPAEAESQTTSDGSTAGRCSCVRGNTRLMPPAPHAPAIRPAASAGRNRCSLADRG